MLCKISLEKRWCRWFSLKLTPKLKKATKVEPVTEVIACGLRYTIKLSMHRKRQKNYQGYCACSIEVFAKLRSHEYTNICSLNWHFWQFVSIKIVSKYRVRLRYSGGLDLHRNVSDPDPLRYGLNFYSFFWSFGVCFEATFYIGFCS